jgi:hypothetical protein
VLPSCNSIFTSYEEIVILMNNMENCSNQNLQSIMHSKFVIFGILSVMLIMATYSMSSSIALAMNC